MSLESEDKPIREIGDKVSAKYVTFIDERNVGLHSAWVPKIQVDGQMMSIYDDTTSSGVKESESRYKALNIARQMRDEAKVKLSQRIKDGIQ